MSLPNHKYLHMINAPVISSQLSTDMSPNVIASLDKVVSVEAIFVVNQKERIKMNRINGYTDRSVSGQASDGRKSWTEHVALWMDRLGYVNK